MKINQIKFFYLSMVFIMMIGVAGTSLYPLVVGSRTAVSVQPKPTFPNTDSNNTMLGFAAFNNGFILQDKTTTCTFDDYFPAAGDCQFNNGQLVLKQDLIFSNTMHWLGGARIMGNNHAVIFANSVPNFSLPESSITSGCLANITQFQQSRDPFSVDWELTDSYMVSVGQQASGGDVELKLGYYNRLSNTLTFTLGVLQSVDTNAARFHPTKHFLAVAKNSGAGSNLIIYEHRIYNGTLPTVSSATLAGNLEALAWHPSGNYLVVGSDINAGEIITYGVSSLGVLGASSSTNLSPDRDLSRNALSFSPGGNKLVAGVVNNATVNASEILIYNFTGSLTLTSSLDVGLTVQHVDWSPTGTYIAVGLSGAGSGVSNLRIYDVSTNPIHELTSARQVLTGEDVYGVSWDKTGTYLIVISSGSNAHVSIFKFDKIAKTLTQQCTLFLNDEAFACKFSRNSNYVAFTYKVSGGNYKVSVSPFNSNSLDPIYFNNTALVLNSDVNVLAPIFFGGTCRVSGRGNRVNLSSGEFVVQHNAQLILENVEIDSLGINNLRCLDDSGSIIVRDSILNFDTDFTFSRGGMQFEFDSLLGGFGNFFYTTCVTSTIASGATLMITDNVIFNYAPACPFNNLIFMQDTTSVLVLSGCTLTSTRTGLHLENGTLVVDQHVTLSSQAVYPTEGIMLDSNLDIRLNGGATLDLYGCIRYEP